MAKIIIIMGVCGSGKTTIGKLLSSKMNIPFYDGDDFHPQANIYKLKNNVPLKDKDRKPWLENLAILIKEWSQSSGAILACSALKESYRKMLSKDTDQIDWIYLSGNYDTIKNRLEQRKKHFMKSTMLQSQLETLEVPSYGIHINIEQNQEEIISEIIENL